MKLVRAAAAKLFQSTHSLRSATRFPAWPPGWQEVSIHALLAECDDITDIHRFLRTVSIHALLAECDGAGLPADKADNVVSIHALLAECDHRGESPQQ